MANEAGKDSSKMTDSKEAKDEEKKRFEAIDCPRLPFTALRPIKGGLLTKQGAKFKSWKKRLFVLQGKYMFYYLSTQDKTPRGALYIGDCAVAEQPEMGKERKAHCFSVHCLKSWNFGNGKTFADRTYYFCTPQFTEMSDWISIIDTMSTTKKEL